MEYRNLIRGILTSAGILSLLFGLSITRAYDSSNQYSDVEFTNATFEGYTNDFSDWTNITRSGDQPNFWQLNSDPAEYRSGGTGTYGTHLQISNIPMNLTNYSFTMEWKVKFTAPSEFLTRRFLRLYSYWTDGTAFITTIQLWDQVASLSFSTDVDSVLNTLTWEPNQWHTITVEARQYVNDLLFIISLNGVYMDLVSYKPNAATKELDFFSFYVYQNNFGVSDSIFIDDFSVNQTGFFETKTLTETFVDISEVTKTVNETTTIVDSSVVTNTVNETMIEYETSTILDIKELTTILEVQDTPEFNLPGFGFYIAAIAIIVIPILRKRK